MDANCVDHPGIQALVCAACYQDVTKELGVIAERCRLTAGREEGE